MLVCNYRYVPPTSMQLQKIEEEVVVNSFSDSTSGPCSAEVAETPEPVPCMTPYYTPLLYIPHPQEDWYLEDDKENVSVYTCV